MQLWFTSSPQTLCTKTSSWYMEVMFMVLIVASDAHQLAGKLMTCYKEAVNPVREGADSVLFTNVFSALSTVPTHRNHSTNSC